MSQSPPREQAPQEQQETSKGALVEPRAAQAARGAQGKAGEHANADGGIVEGAGCSNSAHGRCRRRPLCCRSAGRHGRDSGAQRGRVSSSTKTRSRGGADEASGALSADEGGAPAKTAARRLPWPRVARSAVHRPLRDWCFASRLCARPCCVLRLTCMSSQPATSWLRSDVVVEAQLVVASRAVGDSSLLRFCDALTAAACIAIQGGRRGQEDVRARPTAHCSVEGAMRRRGAQDGACNNPQGCCGCHMGAWWRASSGL